MCVVMTGEWFALAPSATFAQSVISGVAKDSTGGVLPGVTVEAVSPALIEHVRRVVTDGNGLYTFLDLRPGAYSVKFTLSGFATVVRDGIELPASFTATVNVEMRPGALEETIQVAGVAPTVDVRNVLQRSVMSRELTDNLPSTRSPQAFVKFAPGMTSASLGTIAGDRNELNLAMHGSRSAESQIRIDGDQAVMISGQGALYQAMRFNQGIVQEMSILTGAGSAEQENSGVIANIIPREGGNTYSGSLYAGYSDKRLVATNLSDAVKAAGLTTVSGLIRFWDVTPSVGGPLVPNRLWFFAAYRNARSVQSRAGLFEDLSLKDYVYTPDYSRPSTDTIFLPDVNARLTWQVASKHKLSVFVQRNGYAQQNRNADQLLATEATGVTSQIPNVFGQAVWKSPVSNRLLLEAGFSTYLYNRDLRPQPNVSLTGTVSTQDVGGVLPGIWINGIPTSEIWSRWKNYNFDYKANASYLTGSQTFKAGVTLRTGFDRLAA
jgi:Carboxypeptidase regulatory-like domain